ncbi:MAG TPA: 3-hydroxyacyl-ACP dehydratase FabZ family protein [Pirellulales bacterium]|nr:3-hydroxyacyl-ACP dehydratase FabZ family protein [Pirellulales bacterium]
MSGKELILDPAEFDTHQVVADLDEIRRYNLQRFEMEQLSAICHCDTQRQICVGYKDVTLNEFWVRGHMPNAPLMPGVIICEVAAQLSSYFVQKYDLLGAKVVGFGGLEDVKFRGGVVPGDRLVMIVQLLKVRRGAMIVCRFQGFVKDAMVVEGRLKGIPLPLDLAALGFSAPS